MHASGSAPATEPNAGLNVLVCCCAPLVPSQYRWNILRNIRNAIDQNEGGLEKFSKGELKVASAIVGIGDLPLKLAITVPEAEQGMHWPLMHFLLCRGAVKDIAGHIALG